MKKRIIIITTFILLIGAVSTFIIFSNNKDKEPITNIDEQVIEQTNDTDKEDEVVKEDQPVIVSPKEDKKEESVKKEVVIETISSDTKQESSKTKDKGNKDHKQEEQQKEQQSEEDEDEKQTCKLVEKWLERKEYKETLSIPIESVYADDMLDYDMDDDEYYEFLAEIYDLLTEEVMLPEIEIQ